MSIKRRDTYEILESIRTQKPKSEYALSKDETEAFYSDRDAGKWPETIRVIDNGHPTAPAQLPNMELRMSHQEQYFYMGIEIHPAYSYSGIWGHNTSKRKIA